MRSYRALGAVALLVVLVAACGRAPQGPIQTVLADPDRYHEQRMTLSGTLTSLDVRVSHRGKGYYTFELDDGSGRLTVFQFGAPPCADGSRVTVEGQFHRVKQVSGYTFYNQLDATGVTCQ